MAERARRAPEPRPGEVLGEYVQRVAATADERGDHVLSIRAWEAQRAGADRGLTAAVLRARAAGLPWDVIAEAASVSKSTAHSRYGGLAGA